MPLLTLSPDGHFAAFVVRDGSVRLWDMKTGHPSSVLPATGKGAVNGLAFSPDSRSLATIAFDQSVTLWDVASGQARSLYGPPDAASAGGMSREIVFSPDGKTLAWTSQRGIPLCDLTSGRVRDDYPDDRAPCDAIAFSPDGKTLAAASSQRGGAFQAAFVPVIILRDGVTGTAKAALQGSPSLISGMIVSPDGKTLASASHRFVLLWDLPRAQYRVTLRHDAPVVNSRSMSFAPDSKTLATCDFGGVKLWEAASGRLIGSIPPSDPNCKPVSLSFTPDGRSLVIVDEKYGLATWEVQGSRFVAAPAHDDMPSLQGTWRLTRSHGGNMDVPGVESTWSIEGDKLTVSQTITVRGILRYDPSKSSGRDEKTYQGVDGFVASGVYSLQGESLRMYEPEVPGAALPASVPEEPTTGYRLEEWKRQGAPGKYLLDGTWRMTKSRSGPSKVAVLDSTEATIVINGGTYEQKKKDVFGGTLTIETATDPKRFDLSVMFPAVLRGRGRMLGLYRLDGDRLIVTESVSRRPVAISDAAGEFGEYKVFDRVKP